MALPSHAGLSARTAALLKAVSPRIILGSGSYSRSAILRGLGIEFDVIKPDIDERAIRHDKPEELVTALAAAKAAALLARPEVIAAAKAALPRPTLCITADQVVVFEGRILEKPADKAEARSFIAGYGRSPAGTVGAIQVTTVPAADGLRPIAHGPAVHAASVSFSPFTEAEIDALLDGPDGAPMMQCAGGLMVEHPRVWPKHHFLAVGYSERDFCPNQLHQRQRRAGEGPEDALRVLGHGHDLFRRLGVLGVLFYLLEGLLRIMKLRESEGLPRLHVTAVEGAIDNIQGLDVNTLESLLYSALLRPSSTVPLSHGPRAMPVVALGTWKMSPEEAEAATVAALKAGYRHIDTAAVYGNEAAVGRGLRASGVPLADVFVTTKLSPSDQGFDAATAALGASLEALGLESVALYLMHWPGTSRLKPESTEHRANRLASWAAMEAAHASGRAAAIGVCNFTVRHLKELLSVCAVRPAVNQVEFHPLLHQSELASFCESQGIVLEAYSSLGSGALLTHATVVAIAARVGQSPAAVLYRWGLQKRAVILPKSTHATRIAENLSAPFAFALSPRDVAALDALTVGVGHHFSWDPTNVA